MIFRIVLLTRLWITLSSFIELSYSSTLALLLELETKGTQKVCEVLQLFIVQPFEYVNIMGILPTSEVYTFQN